jgi:exosortase family protein XrtF
MIKILTENKTAIRFLLVFVVAYLLMNTAYGFFIRYFLPTSDPFTQQIAIQVAWILSFFDPTIKEYFSTYGEYIAIANSRENMIYVFEGCNGLNVLFVYVSFLLAFKGPWKMFFQFVLLGALGIHLMNLARITALYGVAFYFPDYLYFIHKYLFTGIIYVIVFVFWFLWVNRVGVVGGNR